MKKIICLALIVVMLLSLSSCGRVTFEDAVEVLTVDMVGISLTDTQLKTVTAQMEKNQGFEFEGKIIRMTQFNCYGDDGSIIAFAYVMEFEKKSDADKEFMWFLDIETPYNIFKDGNVFVYGNHDSIKELEK